MSDRVTHFTVTRTYEELDSETVRDTVVIGFKVAGNWRMFHFPLRTVARDLHYALGIGLYNATSRSIDLATGTFVRTDEPLDEESVYQHTLGDAG